MQDTGFIDLRVGTSAAGLGDDSVWPSFTDIMTVIVMIFLLALAIMMARNLELDRQLVTTVSAHDASLLENQGLLDKLNALERKILGLQHSLGTSVSERNALRAQLLAELKRIELLAADNVDLETQLAAIVVERKKLTEQKQQLAAQAQTTSENLIVAQSRNQTLGERIRSLRTVNLELQQQSAQRNVDTSEEIKKLAELIRQRQAENTALQKSVDASSVKFQSLQAEYDSINAKYRNLVRAARNPAGKYVVEVAIIKVDDGYRFSLKYPSQLTSVYYPKEELDILLAKLKSKHGKNLYTKVVIPEYSGLSHNEAWRFTQEILQGYDYYYQ